MKTYKYTVTLELKTKELSKVNEVRNYLSEVLEGEDFKIKSIVKAESIKPRSAKNKGAKFQKWIADKISEVTGIKSGKDELIRSREMGQSGCDVVLIGKAFELYPYSIEAKAQEKFSLPEWIEQARSNQKEGTEWQLFITKNDYKPVVVMDAEFWFNFYKKYWKKSK